MNFNRNNLETTNAFKNTSFLNYSIITLTFDLLTSASMLAEYQSHGLCVYQIWYWQLKPYSFYSADTHIVTDAADQWTFHPARKAHTNYLEKVHYLHSDQVGGWRCIKGSDACIWYRRKRFGPAADWVSDGDSGAGGVAHGCSSKDRVKMLDLIDFETQW